MSTTPETPDARSAAGAELLAAESAQQAAINGTRRPEWLTATISLAGGAAFGSALLGGVLGWTLFWILLVVLIGMAIIDARRVRRRGRIIDGRSMGLSFLWIFAFSIILTTLGSFRMSIQQQPWLAMGAGILIAASTYAFIRWDEASMSKRLAANDFDPYTLF